jgi:predicted O-linked N-acetylglucosamine transferase (SPINDLY family)
MPHTYQPHGRYALQNDAFTRDQFGLPATGFVFCCFNQAFKLTPRIFDVWCRLLEAVPGSVLWLLDSDMAKGNLRNEALRRGIGGQRLVFAPHMNQVSHMERLQLADLVLDTSPYGAHTTASDALWAGVPLVTHSGDTFASRVAGSLLRAVGLEELIAPDFDTYFDLAYELATCPDRLSTIKEALKANQQSAALFDVETYTRDIEVLYQAMWKQHQDGRAPSAINTLSV